MSIPFEQDPAADDYLMTNERLTRVVTTPYLMREIRKALGLSQEQMATLAGISRQMVNYYEKGDAYPSTGTWLNWTMAVGKEIRKLRKQGSTMANETPQTEGEG